MTLPQGYFGRPEAVGISWVGIAKWPVPTGAKRAAQARERVIILDHQGGEHSG